MSSLGEVARFFGGIDRKGENGNYYYHVFMILIQSKMTLQKLLTIRLSDLDNNLFQMRYNKVDVCHFQYLKKNSTIKSTNYLLNYHTRWDYQDFCKEINKRMCKNFRIGDLYIIENDSIIKGRKSRNK